MSHGLSIIIVNYKSFNLITDCLNSFVPNIKIDNWEVIIVDNYSGDDSEILLKREFPFIRYIQMGYNAGFARANNKGITASLFDTVLLLNPDTLIVDGSITHSYLQLTESHYVACGVQLLNSDLTNQVSGSYTVKGGLNYLLPLPFMGAVFKYITSLAKINKPSIENVSGIQEVDWINGAFLMCKKNIIEDTGLLDEDFFLYMEEIEWCSRLRKWGKLCLFGDLKVIHLQGVTAEKHFQSKNKGYQNLCNKMGRQLMLSIWVRQRKEFGIAWLLILVIIYGFETPFFLLCFCIAKVFGRNNYLFQDFLGYTKNYFYNLRFLLPLLRNVPCFYKAI